MDGSHGGVGGPCPFNPDGVCHGDGGGFGDGNPSVGDGSFAMTGSPAVGDGSFVTTGFGADGFTWFNDGGGFASDGQLSIGDASTVDSSLPATDAQADAANLDSDAALDAG